MVSPDETTDVTTSHLTDKTTSHSTRLSKDDNQVAGYNPAKDAGQIIGYSHSTKRNETCAKSPVKVIGIINHIGLNNQLDLLVSKP